MTRYDVTIVGVGIAGALILTGCSNGTSDKEKLENWVPQVESEFNRLIDVMKQGEAAAKDLDIAEMMDRCSHGVFLVRILETKDPMPVESKTWTSMLNSTKKGLSACAAGDFEKSIPHLIDSQVKLKQLESVLDDIPLN